MKRTALSFAIPAAIAASITLALAVGFGWWAWNRSLDRQARELDAYLESGRTFERRIIEGFPIYQDWATPEKEQELRRHLLQDHLAVVESMKLRPVADRVELDERVKAGTLRPLEQNRDTPYFFYNVKKEHRALSPLAVEGMETLAKRLNARTGVKDVAVKYAVSSALRTVEYQEGLRDRNANASFISSHSYGISFDVFYDAYFVALPAPGPSGNAELDRSLDNLRLRTGYWLGESLRRQLHAMLAETLIELQKEGVLFAILEKNQRCYHVTIRPK